MKPPRRIHVGPLTYKIKFDGTACEAANVNGACLRDTEIILLNTGTAPGVERETLLHECLHAVWAQTHLLKDLPDGDADSDGEKAIGVLAGHLIDLIRRNPGLVTYLQEK